jgi:hypothetical protein
VSTLAPVWAVDGWSASQGGLVDAFGAEWLVHQDSGWFEPPGVRLSHQDKLRDHGVFRTRNYRTPRVVVLAGHCSCPDSATMMAANDRFNAIRSDGGLAALLVTEPGGRQRTAMVELGDQPQADPDTYRSFDFQLTLTAQDPRKYDATVQTATTGLPSSTGGLDWSTGGGLNWSSGGGLNWGTITSTGVLVATNAGLADTWPKFTISAGANTLTNPGITITIGGQRLFYNNTLQAGDQLVIVTNPIGRSVLLNGTTDRKPFLTVAEWTSIAPGASVPIAFSAASYTSTATLAASWQNAYW